MQAAGHQNSEAQNTFLHAHRVLRRRNIRQNQPPDHSETADLRSSGDHTYSPNNRPAVVLEDSISSYVNKRKNEEAHSQPGAKRLKPTEVIEISDDELNNDDDHDHQTSNGRPEPEDTVSDNQYSHMMNSDFGGQYAKSHHRGRVEEKIAAYQLHAIWWMLTQQPLRDIQGGCLGDAMGLGKTIEVL
ncbi:hypothetical protein F5Y16DRAFT_406117 [Xylariaceae sp. FL0255]|nr:hypothetical protein F5Y16DRAFT_406117 [Xylariaceae sp. FL0255]